MFAGEHIFILPNKIGGVQLSLLKKRISENEGRVSEKVTKETTRVISSLANHQEIYQALLPLQPPPRATFHSTDWISKALSRGSKCGNDQHTIPNSRTHPTNDLPAQAFEFRRKGSHGSLASSSDSVIPGEGLMRRSSSSKTKFAELNFGDPSFGLKTKSSPKKRSKGDDETPPEKSSSKKEDQEDSFARHLIRKRMKFSELTDTAIHRTQDDILPSSSATFELNYDLSDEDEISISDRRSWSLLTHSTTMKRKDDITPAKALKSSKSSILANDDDDTQSCSIPPLLPSSTFQLDDVAKYADNSPERRLPKSFGAGKEEIWFTGSELPRVLEGVRAAEMDDVEDPKFYALLKSAPEPTKKALDDEIRYQGPCADRLHRQLSAAVKEAFQSDEELDESEVIVLKPKTPQTILDPDSDSQENDFSESHAAFDLSDFGKNFGHSQHPLSSYWERQRKNLACQKLPPSHATSSDSKGVQSSPFAPVKENHNKLVTDQLEKLEQICLGSGDKWRGYAYRKAANILKALTYKVESKDDALKLRGIGTSIAEKIGEIISTGKLRKLDALQSEERIQVLSTFMGIFGVGQSTANKWCALGYKSLEDIEKHATLTYAQAVGLKFYDEFKLRIPRAEMEEIFTAVKHVIHQIDPNFIVDICGSYRRGKADCGDIDIIITHKRVSPLKNVLHQAVPLLHEAHILTHDFVTISEGSDKYMGVCQANPNGKHRRIDMLTVPPAEWPFALLHFTGSGHFNRSMRFWAGKRGYSLSQHGLRVNYGNDNKGPYIAGITTEKQVFEALGLEYRPAEDRDI